MTPGTNQLLEHAKQRIDYLIRKLGKDRAKVAIPSPVLSEILVNAGSSVNAYVTTLHKSPFFAAPFETRAAIECAQAVRKYGLSKKGTSGDRGKVKFDRQIVAIAQVVGAEVIYSDDWISSNMPDKPESR